MGIRMIQIICLRSSGSDNHCIDTTWDNDMLKTTFASLALLMGAGGASAQTTDHSRMYHGAHMVNSPAGQRQVDVARRGKEVMPFSLKNWYSARGSPPGRPR